MGTLINATEAKKRSEIFEENYSANKSARVEAAIKFALERIDQNIKLSTGTGMRSISYMSDKESSEELALILIEHGYTVTSSPYGDNLRVKFSISW